MPLLVLVLVPPVLGKCSEKPAVQRENRRRTTTTTTTRKTFTGGHSIFRSIGFSTAVILWKINSSSARLT